MWDTPARFVNPLRIEPRERIRGNAATRTSSTSKRWLPERDHRASARSEMTKITGERWTRFSSPCILGAGEGGVGRFRETKGGHRNESFIRAWNGPVCSRPSGATEGDNHDNRWETARLPGRENSADRSAVGASHPGDAGAHCGLGHRGPPLQLLGTAPRGQHQQGRRLELLRPAETAAAAPLGWQGVHPPGCRNGYPGVEPEYGRFRRAGQVPPWRRVRGHGSHA